MRLDAYRNILVIKHGAWGDLINATGAFDCIRKNHPDAHITFMTNSPYVGFAEKAPFFDEIWVDDRSKNPFALLKWRQSFLKRGFDRVYDLQNSKRTSLYFKILGEGKRPEWNGIAPGCSHPQTHPGRLDLHAFPRFADQLKQANLVLENEEELPPKLDWMTADIRRFSVPAKSILIVPGSSKTGSYKRWPAVFYAALIQRLQEKGFNLVLLGGPDDHDALEKIRSACPEVTDLSGKTNFYEIAELARHAILTIGNDTGPVHLAAGVGCPTLVLWSKASPPETYAPRGEKVHVLYRENLKELPVEDVLLKAGDLL